ncbi:MAG: methyltransferase domain-containing protein [Clostridia bacterium]|nr:methyltransferase domain-containing protein [Clostridia bacterium]
MLPNKFKERMKSVLGEDYDSFISSLEEGEAIKGLRVNLIKNSTEDFLARVDFDLTKTEYADNGFVVEGEGFGRTPEHHSGMMYMQDPGAMATLTALDIGSDWWVLDLCAAPGGKSSQIAERLTDGFLLSNEYVPKRAKTVVSNFERLGVTNAIVTSLDTGRLPEMFRECFDLVLCDAPCSGEGMFRKSQESIAEWSEENVLACAVRQGEIMENAHTLVRPGGYLLYSTCTYSPEENEGVVSAFLERHRDFSLVPVKEQLKHATSDGLPEYAGGREDIRETRRIYPHKTPGEGQYIALMKKNEASFSSTILYKDVSIPLTSKESAVVDKFIRENIEEKLPGRVRKVGDSIVLISHGCPIPPHSVFMSGVLLGEIRGELFIPSHQFFSAYGRRFKRKLNLTASDTRVMKYLGGEEIDADPNCRGWCAVLFEGVPLGGGKASAGRLKNHYPKGLRNK